MTQGEAEVTLYLVDQLRDRGALVVDVNGVRATFPPKLADGENDKESRRKEKSYEERLFGRLPKGDRR